MFPLGGTGRGELHRAAAIGTGRPIRDHRASRLRFRFVSGRDRGQGQGGGQPQRQQLQLGPGPGGAEPVRRDGHRDRLMRPGRVVLADPRIDCGLRGSQVRERDRIIEQLAAQRAVEPLDLPGGRG
jgi:hypothetical protein